MRNRFKDLDLKDRVPDELWTEVHDTVPSPTPGVYSDSCPLSWWCHPAISTSVVPFSSCLQSFPESRVFSNGSALHIRWPKYWSFSFSISPSNEYSGLIFLWCTGWECISRQKRPQQKTNPGPQGIYISIWQRNNKQDKCISTGCVSDKYWW